MTRMRPLLYTVFVLATAALLFEGCAFRESTPATTHAAPAPSNYFLFLSDVHLASDNVLTNYGDDTGTKLWAVFQTKIDSVLTSPAPPAFILYTGDLPEHGGASNVPRRNVNIHDVLSSLHNMSTQAGIPVFYLPGNNDALGGNYCAFTSSQDSTPFLLMPHADPYPYDSFRVARRPAKTGAYMVADSASALAAGYYAASITPGLRIISLNSVLWSSTVCNACQPDCSSQPAAGARQMQWLARQLAAAAKAKDKVYIAMHVPPGVDAYQTQQQKKTVRMWANNPINPMPGSPNWQSAFLSLIYQYRRVVSGVFYGHTHMDEYRMLYGNPGQDTITQVALSCPGISVRSLNNPGFKLVYFDATSKLPVDFTTFYASNVNPITWPKKPYYKFTDSLQVKSGSSIFESLRDTTQARRERLLKNIYKVQHGLPSYSVSVGLDVKKYK